MNIVADTLRAARALIATRSGWCRGVMARNADGEGADWAKDDAVSFCFLGALCHVCRKNYGSAVFATALDLLREASGQKSALTMMRWNDRAGHRRVLGAYDRAIELAEARG